jgi:predicted cupin superfamily sugar epimerase
MSEITAAEIISILDLEPLPEEGGVFRQTFTDDHSTAIYYLLADGDFSALHLLTGVEVYHWYAGAPLELLQLYPDGTSATVVLGPDLRAGQRPQHAALPGVWQGSSTPGPWVLVGTTMAPSFDWEGFTLGDRATLIAAYPDCAEQITALTR